MNTKRIAATACVCLLYDDMCMCMRVCVCNVPQTIKIYHVYLYGKQTKLFQFNCDYTAQLTQATIFWLYLQQASVLAKVVPHPHINDAMSHCSRSQYHSLSLSQSQSQQASCFPFHVYSKLLAPPRRDCKYINLMKFSPLKTWHSSCHHVSESVIRSRIHSQSHSPIHWQRES